MPRGDRTGPSSSRRTRRQQACSACPLQEASPPSLTKPDRERGEGDHLWPEFLPGGEAVLFTITPANGGIENAQIAVLDLQTGTSKVLIRGGSHAHYVPTGHLVYGVAGTLRAVAFDLGRLEVVGTPAPVLEGVVTTAKGAADVAVAANGSLVYVPGGAGGGGQQTVVSVDRQGRASPLPGLPPDSYRDVRVSPDGARLALATQDDVWIYDVARATLSRLTTDPARTAARSGRPTASASSLRRPERATQSCSGGRRMAPAATSGSSRVRRISSICSPTAGRQTADSSCLPRCRRTFRRDRADRDRAPVRREGAGEKRVLQRHCGRLSRRTLDGLPLQRVRSIRDLCRAVSGARKSAADLDRRRPYPTLVA